MTGSITYAEWAKLNNRARQECDWDRGYCHRCAEGGTCPTSRIPPYSSIIDPPQPRAVQTQTRTDQ